MILLITVSLFITLSIVSYALLQMITEKDHVVATRLRELTKSSFAAALPSERETELAQPFMRRVLRPLLIKLSVTFSKLAPKAIRSVAADKIAMAGGFKNMTVDEFLLLSGTLAVLFPVLTLLVLVALGGSGRVMVGSAVGAFFLGLSWPYLLVSEKIRQRHGAMQKDLPDVLDLLTVSVEAGLGFDGALSKVSEKMKGPLVEEFTRMLHEIRVGVPRREALHALAVRCNVPDLSMFVTALVQADMLGVSIGSVLRVQSAGMRQKRRQRAEEKAMKAPIKMMLPLVLFIFPTIFIVLLGPALIQIITSFKNM